MANRSLHCEPVHNRLTMAASDNPEVGTVYSTDYGGDDCISTVSSMSTAVCGWTFSLIIRALRYMV